MIAPLELLAAPARPSIVFARRKLSSDLPTAYVDSTIPTQLTVVVQATELTDRGAYYLYAAIRHNLNRGHWQRTKTGLLLRQTSPADQTAGSWPPVTFESVKLNRKAPVMIVDHPKELHVLVDKRELTTEGAVALTDAVRDHMANGQWSRMQSGLWLTA